VVDKTADKSGGKRLVSRSEGYVRVGLGFPWPDVTGLCPGKQAHARLGLTGGFVVR
jgi:hypothetical protein